MPGPDLDENEQKLVLLALDGDTDAFGVLVDSYWDKVTALVYQKLGRFPEVEDIVQETFIKAYNFLPQLRKPGNFAAWLYQIASKLCIDHLRSSRHKGVSLDAMQEREVQFEKPARSVEPSDLFDEIMKAVGALPELYRVVVTLRFMSGMSCKEIAQHLGEPQGTIRNRLFRANEILRDKLEKRLDDFKPQPADKDAEGKTSKNDSEPGV